MKKAYILFLYGVALYFILRKYYEDGNEGLPEPTVLVAPTYLYGILTLSSDFLEGLPVILASGFTVALIWQVQNQKSGSGKAVAPPGPKGPTGKTSPANPNGPPGPGGKPFAPSPTATSGPNGPSGPTQTVLKKG